MGGMSVGRWLSFGVCLCVLDRVVFCINIWWETPSIERSLSTRFSDTAVRLPHTSGYSCNAVDE